MIKLCKGKSPGLAITGTKF